MLSWDDQEQLHKLLLDSSTNIHIKVNHWPYEGWPNWWHVGRLASPLNWWRHSHPSQKWRLMVSLWFRVIFLSYPPVNVYKTMWLWQARFIDDFPGETGKPEFFLRMFLVCLPQGRWFSAFFFGSPKLWWSGNTPQASSSAWRFPAQFSVTEKHCIFHTATCELSFSEVRSGKIQETPGFYPA